MPGTPESVDVLNNEGASSLHRGGGVCKERRHHSRVLSLLKFLSLEIELVWIWGSGGYPGVRAGSGTTGRRREFETFEKPEVHTSTCGPQPPELPE